MMLSKMKTLTLIVVFTTALTTQAISLHSIDEKFAALWPFKFSLAQEDLAKLKTLREKALESKKRNPIQDKGWFDYVPLADAPAYAKALEGILATDSYEKIRQGKMLSNSTYDFLKAYDDAHYDEKRGASSLRTKYSNNVTWTARKVQMSLILGIIASIAAYKYRKQIAEKLKAFKQRLVKAAPRKA